jgi:hypothetical protein
MYDRVSATLPARACLLTLASASWVTRSSVTSASGLSDRGVPVTVVVAVTPVSSASRSVSRPSASPSEAAPSCSVRRSQTSRRTSARLSLAVRLASSRCRLAASAPCGSSPSAACSCSTMLTKPWARVSWMSRASRWRSASRPDSRSAAASSLRVDSSCSMSSRRPALCSMMRVIQIANRVPNSTDSRPPPTADQFSERGRPDSSTSRQTTTTVSAIATGTARAGRSRRKICGYRASSSEK